MPTNIKNDIQSILFIANRPLILAELANAIGCDEAIAKDQLDQLILDLKDSGLSIVELDHAYQLTTNPNSAKIVRKYLSTEAHSELSKPALETLAIIAYKGPITKTSISEIRGVSSETMIKNLLQRGLIQESQESTGTKSTKISTMYQVSHKFLQYFGLSSLDDLPAVEEKSINEA